MNAYLSQAMSAYSWWLEGGQKPKTLRRSLLDDYEWLIDRGWKQPWDHEYWLDCLTIVWYGLWFLGEWDVREKRQYSDTVIDVAPYIVANPVAVASFMEGKESAVNAIVGAVMKDNKGANAPVIKQQILEVLNGN